MGYWAGYLCEWGVGDVLICGVQRGVLVRLSFIELVKCVLGVVGKAVIYCW